MRRTTKQAAQGKWDGIIRALLGEEAINRKHGPCPMCGGKDRYRYDNNRNNGDWFCSVCGAGDGFELVTRTLSIDFAEAARKIDAIVNNVELEPFTQEYDIDRRRKALNECWRNSRSGHVAHHYLLSRGLPNYVISEVKDLRGHDDLHLYELGAKLGSYPAMIALIRNGAGEPVSIHRTYLTGDKRQKKIMPPIENITGGCVRLGEPNETLVLAEGIETALAGWAYTGHPAWATISAHGLAEFRSIPRHVTKVIICADNDASFTGQEAAFACAKTMKQKLKVDTEVLMPSVIGLDMLDAFVDLSGPNKHQMTMLEWRP